MHNFKRSCVAFIGLVAFIGGIALIVPQSALGQKAGAPAAAPSPVPPGQTVKVINTSAEPVPVTGTVNVGNLGDSPLPVQVVNASNAPAPVTGTVNVANVGNSPLIVRDADNPAIQPVQGQGSCAPRDWSLTDCSLSLDFTVPAGKRLVIEFFSMRIETFPGDDTAKLEYWTVTTKAGGQWVTHGLPLPPPGPGTGVQVRLYADPGQQIGMAVKGNRGGPSSPLLESPTHYVASFSGYLVNVP